jgi:hypothetical protein
MDLEIWGWERGLIAVQTRRAKGRLYLRRSVG